MADISDVEQALCDLIQSIIYPKGVANGSVTGTLVKIYRGWPANRALNADLSVGTDTVTVFSRQHATRDTSRYPRSWHTMSIMAPTMAVTISGETVALTGTGGAGQTIGLIVDGLAYAQPVSDADTPETVAALLAAQIPGAVAQGDLLSLLTCNVQGRVIGSGTAIMETRRQEQGVLIAVWSATPAARDALASSIDQSLSDVDWFVLSDLSSARLEYRETFETDISENANLYRRDLHYVVEYPTTISMTSSQMAFGIGTLGGSGPSVGFGCLVPPARLILPPLGAIRFDAWYDPTNTIDMQCAAALSPAAYNSRLPPNASITDGSAGWPMATQTTMDAEIVAALQCGLQFWAFDSYQPNDTLSLALQLYLSSALRSRMRFCMLGQSSNWGENGQDQPSFLRDIQMMTQPGYMTVLGDRPLYFVLDAQASQTQGLPPGGVAEAIVTLRRQVQLAGGGNPYVVWLSTAALVDYSNVAVAQAMGADAAGAYAVPRLNGVEQPYGALTEAASQDWIARGAAGFPMVPTAMSGWDQRPFIQTPQAFYSLDPGIGINDYYDTAEVADLGDHIVDMARFVTQNPDCCPAQVGLIYAWNELAEGGWLMPTYATGGPDAQRCAAIGAALSGAAVDPTTPNITLIN